MGIYETLRQWKDPEFRGDAVEHPAGDIDLTGAGVNAVPANSAFTVVLSCLDCDQTVGNGTCRLATAGCCRSDDEMW